MARLALAEFSQQLDHVARAPARRENLVEARVVRCLGRGVHSDHFGAADDAGDDIAEIVREAVGQGVEGLE